MQIKDIDISTFTELFLEQYELDLLRKQGYRVEIYFDSDEIFQIIQGYWALNNAVIETELLDGDLVLRGLVYFRKLLNLKVFKPHIHEISNYLKREEYFPLHEIPNEIIEGLFKSFEIVNIKKYDLANKIHLNYLSTVIPKSPLFFKYYYILDEPKWSDRAKRLFTGSNAIFKSDTTDYPIDKLVESKLFVRIYEQLSEKRSHKSLNNFRDALSLTMLHHKKNEFRKTKVIPIFLSSAQTFDYVFSNEEIAKKFLIGNNKISTVHKVEFFLIDVIFGNQETTSKFFKKLDDLIKKRNLLKDFKQDEPFISALYKDIDEFFKLEFFQIFKNILNNTEFDFETSVNKLYEFQESVSNTEFAENLERHRQELTEQLENTTADFELLEKIWIAVENIKPIKIKIDSDIFRDTSITRFSPSIKTGNKLRQLWNSITTDVEIDQIPYRIKAELVVTIFKGFNQKNYENLVIGCCVLWIFDEFKVINLVLDRLNFDYGNNFSLAIMHASSLCNFNDQNKRFAVNKILDCINLKLKTIQIRYQHLMGLSYVNFRFWESEVSPLHPVVDVEIIKLESEFYTYALDAIERAYQAYKTLEVIKNKEPIKVDYRNIKFYYSLNIYIYYVTRAAKPDVFLTEDFENSVITFEDADGTYWQPTFNHTLASYYARKFFLEESPKRKKTYIEMADKQYQTFVKTSTVINKRFKGLEHFIEANLAKYL